MALDNFRKVNITLNKANQRVLETQIAKVGDANGRELVVQITNNGIIEDQTGTTLKLNWQHENGKQGSTTFSVVDIKTGIFSVYYPTEMLYKGKVNASIEITSNGQITNSMNFKIIVQADVFDGEAGNVDGVFISLAEVNKKLDDREVEYVELKNRQSSVENQFDDIKQEMLDKDVISAPEIIEARSGYNTLDERLDKEQQEVVVLSTKELNINSYSDLVVNEISDGIMDWTNAINTAISEMNKGDTLVLPNNHVYGTTDTIHVNKAINIIGEGNILSHHEGVAILFYPESGKLMHMNIDISLEKKTINWDSGSVGVLIRDAYYSTFKLRKVNNFTKNLLLEAIRLPTNASGAVTYCRFFIDEMNNHKEGITFKSRTGIGWVTENSFYGGSLGNGYGIGEEGIHVVFDSDEPGWNNNNKFFGTSFEGHYKRAVKGTETSNNVFNACRFEMPYMTTSVEWVNSGCQHNVFRDGYGIGNLLNYMIDNGRYNIVSGSSNSSGRFEYYDRKVYQFMTGVATTMKKYENFETVPIGKRAYIKVRPVDGVLTIDLKEGTEFSVLFGGGESVINKINVINKPNSPNGMEFDIVFHQTSVGEDVLKLPGEGTYQPLPVNRPYGIDVYTFKFIGEVGNFLLCVNHTAR